MSIAALQLYAVTYREKRTTASSNMLRSVLNSLCLQKQVILVQELLHKQVFYNIIPNVFYTKICGSWKRSRQMDIKSIPLTPDVIIT